jgi:drug/metabolite transporter (DMT)-like permease
MWTRTSSASFLLVAGAAALWGTDALFRQGLARGFPAAAVVLGEHALLVAVTLPLLWRALPRARAVFDRWDWGAAAVIGVGASATATALFTLAFAYGDPNTPLLLQQLQPLFAVAGAWLILGERPRSYFGAYLVAGVAGAYLVAFENPTQVGVSALAPALLAVGAALLWGMGTVLGRRLTAKLGFGQVTAVRFAFGLPAAAVIAWLTGGLSSLGTLGGQGAGSLVALALVPGLVALLLYYRGLRGTPAAAATLGELAFPLSATVLNYLVFGATLVATQWVGVGLLAATITVMGVASERGERGLGVDVPEPRREPADALA